jgi:protein TonB
MLGSGAATAQGFGVASPRPRSAARQRAVSPEARPSMRPLQRHPDELGVGPRRAMVGVVLAAHLVLGWGLLQIREVRETVAEAAPLVVSWIAPVTPPPPAVIEPPPPPRSQPVVKRQRPPEPKVVSAAPHPAPAPFVAPAPLPEPPAPVPVAPPAPAVAAAPAAAPIAPPPAPVAPPPAPKVIPASAVQYLEPIALEYPRLSKRNGETGRVLIRVYIDEAGLAKNLQVNRSSGHPRLDEAALAAIQKARFKPYTENGQPVAGWAVIPLEFELEK